jgi:hypothetical protein
MKCFSLILSFTTLLQGVSFIPPCPHRAAQHEENTLPACCQKNKKSKEKICFVNLQFEESQSTDKDSCCGDFCKCSGKIAKNIITFKYYEASYKSLFNPKTGFKYQDWYEFDYLSRLLEPPQLA